MAFINLAGFPAQISLSGMFFVTTDPAPMTELLPMLTPFKIIEPAPINAPQPIFILSDFINLLFVLSSNFIG